MKKFLVLLLLVFGSFAIINGQTINEFQVGLAVPQGDFADDDENDALYDGSGVAATGLYLGYKAITSLSVENLYWTFNAGIMYNDFQSDFKDDLEDALDEADDYKLPKYLNVPLMFGLQYEKYLSDEMSLFGEAGLGINVLKITNMSTSVDNYEGSTIFQPSVGLGYKIGGGIVIQEKYTISLNYLSLGSHKVKYKDKYEFDGERETDSDKFNKALSIASLNITLGIRF